VSVRVDVAVIGGGVIGSSIAYHVARRGRRVAVFDIAAPASAPSASWASAGGVRQQGRDPREWRLTREAAARWPALTTELGADLEYRQGGHLHLVERDEDLRALEARVARERAAGLDVHMVYDRDLRAVAPDVMASARAGAYSPGDGQANPRLTTRAFAAAAVARGATYYTSAAPARLLHDGDRIEGVESAAERAAAEWVVLAAGAWSTPVAAEVGLDLPIATRAPQMLLTDPAPAALVPTVTAAGHRLSLKQLPSGEFFIGGGWPSDIDHKRMSCAVRSEHVDRSRCVAAAVFPPLRLRRIAQVWCGLEAQSIDGVPLLGMVPGLDGLCVAVGFSGHGFQLSPAVGRAVADLLTGRWTEALEPLSPSRFVSLAAAAIRAFRSEADTGIPPGALG